MDFSSVPRVLESLQRRRPALDESIVQRANELRQHVVSKSDDKTVEVWMTTIQEWLSLSIEKKTNDDASSSKTPRWEPLAVGLYLATDLLQKQPAPTFHSPSPDEAAAAAATVYMDGPRVPSMVATTTTSEETKKQEITGTAPTTSSSLLLLDETQLQQVCQLLHAACLQHLEHAEPRVRTLVAKAVAAYAPHATDSCRELHDTVLQSIHEHIVAGRQETAPAEEDGGKDAAAAAAAPEESATTSTTTTTTTSYSRSSTGALDDTTGWRALETNWQCLASLISALGGRYFDLFPVVVQDAGTQPQQQPLWLQDCQYSAVTHVNRHVRAASMAVLEQCVLAAGNHNKSSHLLTDTASPLRQVIVAVLRTGLADNWSQVRMAASVLCRAFMTRLDWSSSSRLQDPSNRSLLAVLVPRMCLNRFYLAQGVKLYSHETWKCIFPTTGLPAVAQHLAAVVRYYVKMADADNHVVREAACQAIAELAVRLGSSSSNDNNEDENGTQEEEEDYRALLQPHVPVLLQALIMCFHDESWPVRDEACLATATLAKSFPAECQPEFNTLWERWTEQLTDQIWSVRQDAAVALGDALDAYGETVWDLLLQKLIPKILPAALEQPALTREEYAAHLQDAAAHTGAQLYSCGSLAPKLSKRKDGAGRIGCTNCGIDRPKAPWEATDGCIYLLRELCLRCDDWPALQNDTEDASTGGVLVPLLTQLADVCRVQHFPQADELRATLWKQLPVMAHGLGKQRFKRAYLHIFMDLLFWHLDSRSASALSLHAAGHCAEQLADLVGRTIFRGRLDDRQQETFDRVMRQRAQDDAAGHMMMPDEGAFSPYGPPGLLDGIGGAGGTATAAPFGSAGGPLGRFP